jgi:ABC-type enterobactin transport system permease subunit
MNRQGVRLYERMTWADVAEVITDVVEHMIRAAQNQRRLDEIELGTDTTPRLCSTRSIQGVVADRTNQFRNTN